MIGGKKVLALIPARGGSKGVQRKNLRLLGGKPLIAWTIEEARKSKYIDRLIVSSEDPEILEISRRLGAETPFVRPERLAQDDSPGMDVVFHAIEQLPGYDILVELQPTSPLRQAEDIDACLEQLDRERCGAVISVAPASQNPYWMYTLDAKRKMTPLVSARKAARRQELPASFVLNGALYSAAVDFLKTHGSFLGEETQAFVMPADRSIDIDTERDFQIAEILLGKIPK